MDNTIFKKELSRLNAQQREAVEAIEGPVMVVAGPGTGKTQIIAMRIANILRETQTNPSNILALTFTESGVYAIKERLLKIIGPVSYQVNVHTFHSFANEIILQNPDKFLFAREINQLTDVEQIQYLQKIIRETELEMIAPPKSPYHYQGALLKAINDLKQEGIASDKFEKIVQKELSALLKRDDLYHAKGPYKGKMKGQFSVIEEQLKKNLELAIVYENYQELLTKDGRYDYADMILFVLQALKKDPVLLSIYQERFQYILVDEYQDTNSAQNEIVRVLAAFYDNPNVFVVGDDEQSIYRFQGAALENILFFEKTYPAAQTIVLKYNYRSAQILIDAARSVIKNNKSRLPLNKDFQSANKNIGQIFLGNFSSGALENYFVAREIEKLKKQGTNLSQIAVLYRKHSEGEGLAEQLARLNIPYKLAVGENVLEDGEIKKILKILKVLDTGPGEAYLDRDVFEIMHFPFFKIEPVDIYKISREAEHKKMSILDLMTNEKNLAKLLLAKTAKIKSFVKIIFSCIEFSHNHTFAESFQYILNETKFLKYLVKLEDSALHLNRLQSLFNEIKRLNARQKDLDIHQFRDYLEFMQDNNLKILAEEIEADFEGVNLMTAHKAKGLEFEVVFIIHAGERSWGSAGHRDLIKLPPGLLKIEKNPEEDEEEERRLFYVALTRAKKNLYLTSATRYGEEESANLCLPSKFLAEIEQNLITNIDTKKFELKFSDQLQLAFSEIEWRPKRAIKDYLKGILAHWSLSSTALNSYLACPRKFYLDNLLRVPRVKDFNQAYGTAVHEALERFYHSLEDSQKVPTKKELLNYFEMALGEEILSADEAGRALKKGVETLKAYYDFYDPDFGHASSVGLEYNFSSHEVHFKDVPITGKIDRIEIIEAKANSVRIIDYKTSQPKSLNYLLGLTREKDLSLFYQAYFYKLLADIDPLFRWKVKEIVFDFVEPVDGKFKRVAIPIEPQQYLEFQELVIKTYQNIMALKFRSNSKSCRKTNRTCDYLDFC